MSRVRTAKDLLDELVGKERAKQVYLVPALVLRPDAHTQIANVEDESRAFAKLSQTTFRSLAFCLVLLGGVVWQTTNLSW